MRPINADSSNDQSSYQVQKVFSGQNQEAAKTGIDQKGAANHLPEDFVDLSAPQGITLKTSAGKRNSTHVTNEEKKALFDSFSGKTGFSVYS